MSQIVNPLCDNQASRLSFALFAKKIKGFVEHYGREQLVLTYRPDLNASSEVIGVEELDSHRSGIYRARIANDESKFVEATFTSSMDAPPRDGRVSIDKSYQDLIDILNVRVARAETTISDVESKLRTERDLRFAAEDEARRLARENDELKEALSEAEDNAFDDSIIEMGRSLFADFSGTSEVKESVSQLVDVLEEHPDIVELMGQRCPKALRLLLIASGENPDTPEEEQSE